MVHTASGTKIPSWVGSLLQVPLAAKLVGANAIMLIVALSAVAIIRRGGAGDVPIMVLFGGTLIGSAIVNLILIFFALRPLADLESTAQRVWRGDLTARVPRSILADVNLQRVGGALNVLLDGVAADRGRLRELTARVIRAGDDERSHIARELHDSTAQSLAALLMELSVVIRENDDPRDGERLERIRRIASDVLDEVRMLSQTVHPRVLDDLGLGAALQHLARESEARGSIRIEVVVEDTAHQIGQAVSSVLYRVAQEALNNALRHANATCVLMRAGVEGRIARLEVSDDGVGFSPEDADRRRPGMGLFTMRERMALVDGALGIDSAPGRGTRVIASVPLLAPARAAASSETTAT
ncbi:MAG: sensor histidine kinase [Gemmatimonadaceae bacterium]|nr:sensor histidine kinase [Gemmatimonadaceae bacterium]